MFPIKISGDHFNAMVIERRRLKNLTYLRERIKKAGKVIYLYAWYDRVYGYGRDLNWLANEGFRPLELSIYDVPRLTSRMILDGILDKAMNLGFNPIFSKGRVKLFSPKNFNITSNKRVFVYKGYDLRVFFFKFEPRKQIIFSLVCDVIFFIRDEKDRPLNFREIISKYGTSTLREVRIIQGDLIPTGINTEIARQRFLDDIIPFVRRIGDFKLNCGLTASINHNPIRIIIGE